MADSYSKIYIQIVFAVRKRNPLISPAWEEELFKYMTGIITQKGQKLLAINGLPDHIHIFMGIQAKCCLSDLVREIKKSSNNFIKKNGFVRSHFQWQEGFAAFSYGQSQIGRVIKYIDNQKQHHLVRTFEEEYIEFLERFDIKFKLEHIRA
jgi:REP element-mobilizing transposase RayT